MGVEGSEAQPKKSHSRKYVEALLGWAAEESKVTGVYETALLTSLFEYLIVIFFGVWLIIEYASNVYEQQYFGSFNPIFLVIVLMAASGYGFTRLVSVIRSVFGVSPKVAREDDY